MTNPHFFTQWRPSRSKDTEREVLYICAFWRVRGPMAKQSSRGAASRQKNTGFSLQQRLPFRKPPNTLGFSKRLGRFTPG